MKKTLFFAARVIISFMVFMSVFYSLEAGTLIRLFMENEEIIAYGTRFLRGFCLALPFLCTDFLAVGVFQAVGMGRESFLFAVLRKIVLEIPALCILNAIFPLYGLAYAQTTAEVILAIAAVLVLRRMFKKLDRTFSQKDA